MRRLLVLLLALTAPAAAQSPAERSGLARWADSLDGVSDRPALRTLAGRLETDPSGPDALRRIRLGLVRLRLARLGEGGSFDEAGADFRRAARSEPAWPWPRHAVGLAQERKGEWQAATPQNLGNRVGYGAFQAAVRAYADALALDPGFGPSLDGLARMATRLRDSTTGARALAAFRGAATRPAPAPGTLLALGRLELLYGQGDSAVAAFRRFLAGGWQAGLARLELARSLLGLGDPSGTAPYYAGAADDDPAAVAGYRADLAFIADSAELAAFDGASGAGRVAVLREFWSRRDARDLRSSGERIREHYRRLLHARRHYALQVNRRYYAATDAYRSGRDDVDDRGVIFIRQGEPDDRTGGVMFGTAPNETWVYRRADGDLLLHFSGGGADGRGGPGGALDDYRLVPSLLDVRGDRGFLPFDMLLQSRAAFSDLYSAMLAQGRYGRARAARTERAIGEASIAAGVTTDEHPLRFREHLPAAHDHVALGSTEGLGLVHLVYGIRVPPASVSGPPALPVRVRLSVYGPGGTVARLDSGITLRLAGPVRPGGLAVGSMAVPVPPGAWSYRLALSTSDETGIVFPTGTMAVRNPALPGLGVSDVALGHLPGGWPLALSPGDTALVSPVQSYAEGSWVSLYYEVHGLAPGTPHSTRIRIVERRHGRDGRTRLALSFEEEAAGPLTPVRRNLDLGDLRPGAYRLEVRLADGSGQTAMAARDFEVHRASAQARGGVPD